MPLDPATRRKVHEIVCERLYYDVADQLGIENPPVCVVAPIDNPGVTIRWKTDSIPPVVVIDEDIVARGGLDAARLILFHELQEYKRSNLWHLPGGTILSHLAARWEELKEFGERSLDIRRELDEIARRLGKKRWPGPLLAQRALEALDETYLTDD